MKYLVIYEKTGTGYSAYAPDLPGCITTGSSLEETESLMREAIEFHIESMRESVTVCHPLFEGKTRHCEAL
jgi:predicted RNase H-like HicB family nuclease